MCVRLACSLSSRKQQILHPKTFHNAEIDPHAINKVCKGIIFQYSFARVRVRRDIGNRRANSSTRSLPSWILYFIWKCNCEKDRAK